MSVRVTFWHIWRQTNSWKICMKNGKDWVNGSDEGELIRKASSDINESTFKCTENTMCTRVRNWCSETVTPHIFTFNDLNNKCVECCNDAITANLVGGASMGVARSLPGGPTGPGPGPGPGMGPGTPPMLGGCIIWGAPLTCIPGWLYTKIKQTWYQRLLGMGIQQNVWVFLLK